MKEIIADWNQAIYLILKRPILYKIIEYKSTVHKVDNHICLSNINPSFYSTDPVNSLLKNYLYIYSKVSRASVPVKY